MDKGRYDRGMKVFREIHGRQGEGTLASLREVSGKK